MTYNEKKSLYESIMKDVDKIVKKRLNESLFDFVIIKKGPNKKTWNYNGYVIELKSDRNKYIVLLESKCKGISYEMHIENESDSSITQEEKNILFNALYDLLKDNDVLTSFGGCTPGGLIAIENLIKKYRFKKIGTYSGEKLYWSSPRLIGSKRFNDFINNPEHRDMYKIIDKSKPLSVDNTTPIISVIKKIKVNL